MAVEIVVPVLGESVTEATVAQWLKKPGEAVAQDEPLVELETDKVTLEVGAPANGVVAAVSAEEGATVEVGAVLGLMEEGDAPAAAAPAPAPTAMQQPTAEVSAAPMPKPAAPAPAAAARIMPTEALKAAKAGSWPAGHVSNAVAAKSSALTPTNELPPRQPGGEEEVVRMSRLRQTIARRLKEAQDNAAMLTTFNDVDMSAIMALRKTHQEAFVKKYGIKLGFMSFFAKACVAALQELPAVNAEIYGTDIIYKNYYNIGVAVGTENGLVVPVIRNADTLGFADIEGTIADFGKRARDGKLSMAEMSGGTFTISNGGIYGSMLSTPILNQPQSAILGMHKIEDRPVAINGEVVIRPMMYLALSYDHRIIDGREAVTFLVKVKENIEDPSRLLFGI
ncbi:MAG: dihydrolipoyllysine-residue succinyltransferase [Geminicoccus sp.]|nr:dihydrolipoyllysine-residue succinyltransferase [Geminicoccus sp.]